MVIVQIVGGGVSSGHYIIVGGYTGTLYNIMLDFGKSNCWILLDIGLYIICTVGGFYSEFYRPFCLPFDWGLALLLLSYSVSFMVTLVFLHFQLALPSFQVWGGVSVCSRYVGKVAHFI